MSHYVDISSGYDDLFAFRKTYEKAFTDDVVNCISRDDLDTKDMIVADIGSGTGAMLESLGEVATFRKFLAVEPCAAMLEHVRDYGDTPTEKFCMDGNEFSELENVRYDAAILYAMVHHIPEKKLPAFLVGIYNQISPGGNMVVSTYSSKLPFPFWPELVRATAGTFPTWDNLQESIRAAGFEDVTCVKRSYGNVVLPRDVWLRMLRNRFVSSMWEKSDEDIEEGIKSMDYPDPVVFEEWQYFLKGRKPLAPGARI